MTTFKRRQRVEARYASGERAEIARIVRYQDMSNVPGRPDLAGLTGWWLIKRDDGSMSSCHETMLRAI